jgi:hypothetical protein
MNMKANGVFYTRERIRRICVILWSTVFPFAETVFEAILQPIVAGEQLSAFLALTQLKSPACGVT